METRARSATWRFVYLLAALGIYLVDQATKAWAVRTMQLGEDRIIIRGLLKFNYAINPGIAFSQFQNGGSAGRWFFAALALTAAIGVFIYFWRTPRTDDRLLGACALLLAGILGNFTDRLRLGYVIDFITLHAGAYHWPTFNVADAAICAGAILLIIDLFMDGKSQEPEVSAQSTEERPIAR